MNKQITSSKQRPALAQQLDEYLAALRKEVIGGLTANAFCDKWRARFFQQAVAFWNAHKPDEPWHPQPINEPEISKNARHLLELGLHLYRSAVPNCYLTSIFPADAVIYLGEASSSEKPAERIEKARKVTDEEATLSTPEWATLKESINLAMARHERAWIRQQAHDGTCSMDEADAFVRARGLPPLIPVINFNACVLPDQEWTRLEQAIVVLALGDPERNSADIHFTEEAAELARSTLYGAARSGHVHIYGNRMDSADAWERIGSRLDWAREDGNFYWDRVKIGDVVWTDVQVKTATMAAWVQQQVHPPVGKLHAPHPQQWWPEHATALQKSYNQAITIVLADEPSIPTGEIERRVWDYLSGNKNLTCAASSEAHRKQVRSARERYAVSIRQRSK